MNIHRVLMTGDTVGGVWTFTLELAESLTERGIEVLLVSFGGPASDAQRAEAAAIPGLRLLDSAFRLEWMQEPWADIDASGKWLLEVEEDYRPDVVHLNTFGHGGLPWSAPLVVTAHSCVLSWWQAVKGEAAPESWNRYRQLVARSLNAADLVTTPSGAMASAICAHYGLPKQACRVLPNGRNVAKFQPLAKEPFVFTAGRLWDEAKNVQAVARIASNLSWPVYLAGDTNGYATSSNAACAGGCNMLGKLPASDIAAWYGRASVYAMPAHYEPFGLSILEAALSACALVVGDLPSLREIWGDTAFYVAPGNPQALERTLQRLIDDPALRSEAARRSYARALSFNSSRMSRAYLGAYHDASMSQSFARSRSSVCVL